MPAERLQKLIAARGIASRREAEALIVTGRVLVDGRPARLGERVDPDRAVVTVDGRPLPPPVPRIYLACHKPPGVTSTVRDPHAARTVVDLVPAPLRPPVGRLFPVGRLDRESEGLILLTTDGGWAARILHPRYGLEREYLVAVDRPLSEAVRRRLTEGVELAEGHARFLSLRPADPRLVARIVDLLATPPPDDLIWYQGVLLTGWKRQVRRMLASVDRPVRRLVRIRIGPLRLGHLPAGAVRRLRPEEVGRLAGGGEEPPAP